MGDNSKHVKVYISKDVVWKGPADVAVLYKEHPETIGKCLTNVDRTNVYAHDVVTETQKELDEKLFGAVVLQDSYTVPLCIAMGAKPVYCGSQHILTVAIELLPDYLVKLLFKCYIKIAPSTKDAEYKIRLGVAHAINHGRFEIAGYLSSPMGVGGIKAIPPHPSWIALDLPFVKCKKIAYGLREEYEEGLEDVRETLIAYT